MQRVTVIGNAAGGKTTLSRELSTQHNLPLHELDALLWGPGWVRSPEVTFDTQHDALVAGSRWLIEGYGPWPAVQRRLKSSDTIILIDLPLRTHLLWALKREMGLPPADRRPLLKLVKMIWWLHRHMRPKLLQAINAEPSHATLHHIRTKAQLNALPALLRAQA